LLDSIFDHGRFLLTYNRLLAILALIKTGFFAYLYELEFEPEEKL
jgi:hypothetical protein